MSDVPLFPLDGNGYERPTDYERMEERVAALEDALARIQQIQPEMLETFRKHGIVFSGPLGTDPSNWEHVAFSVYTRLCEVESIASAALPDSNWCKRP